MWERVKYLHDVIFCCMWERVKHLHDVIFCCMWEYIRAAKKNDVICNAYEADDNWKHCWNSKRKSLLQLTLSQRQLTIFPCILFNSLYKKDKLKWILTICWIHVCQACIRTQDRHYCLRLATEDRWTVLERIWTSLYISINQSNRVYVLPSYGIH